MKQNIKCYQIVGSVAGSFRGSKSSVSRIRAQFLLCLPMIESALLTGHNIKMHKMTMKIVLHGTMDTNLTSNLRTNNHINTRTALPNSNNHVNSNSNNSN